MGLLVLEVANMEEENLVLTLYTSQPAVLESYEYSRSSQEPPGLGTEISPARSWVWIVIGMVKVTATVGATITVKVTVTVMATVMATVGQQSQ